MSDARLRVVEPLARLLLGLTFLLSGWLKGIDVYGCGLRTAAMADAFGLPVPFGLAQVACVGVSALEMLLGLCLLCRLRVREASVAALLLMVGFTVQTAAMAMLPAGAIETCGCFGELVSLSPLPTFLKNVVLLALAAWNCRMAFGARRCVEAGGLRHIALCAAFAFAVPLSSWLFLPAIDFLPYNRGTSIADDAAGMVMGKETAGGELVAVDASTVLVRSGYTMVLVANGEQTERTACLFASLADRCRKDGAEVLSVSSGGKAPVAAPLYFMDRTELRQLLRADNGAVLLRGRRIVGKWNTVTMPLASVKSLTVSAAVQTMILPLFLLGHLAFALLLLWPMRRARKGGLLLDGQANRFTKPLQK